MLKKKWGYIMCSACRTLPEDILEKVAAWLPLEERLGSFSLASHSTHAAAVAVTDYVSWWRSCCSAPRGPAAAALAAAARTAPALARLSLGALTKLTYLVIGSSSIIAGCCDVCGWLASQLAHLPRLRNLYLADVHEPYTSAGAAALASTLQQLQDLTSLCLKVD
jgi:hypothetical protein